MAPNVHGKNFGRCGESYEADELIKSHVLHVAPGLIV